MILNTCLIDFCYVITVHLYPVEKGGDITTIKGSGQDKSKFVFFLIHKATIY